MIKLRAFKLKGYSYQNPFRAYVSITDLSNKVSIKIPYLPHLESVLEVSSQYLKSKDIYVIGTIDPIDKDYEYVITDDLTTSIK